MMFRKTTIFPSLSERRYKKVASRKVEIPFYRGIGRRVQGFSALAQVIGRTAIPYLRKYIVPAPQRVGADLLEVDGPEVAEVVTGRENFKTAANYLGGQPLGKQLGRGNRRKNTSRVVRPKAAKQTKWWGKHLFTNISHQSRQLNFGTNLLWQFLEILDENYE